MWWHYTPKGGYGYTQKVDAEVIEVKKRVKIKVRRIRPTERIEYKWVTPERLELQ